VLQSSTRWRALAIHGAHGHGRGRPLRDLRISVTDRWQFTLWHPYCMPRASATTSTNRFLKVGRAPETSGKIVEPKRMFILKNRRAKLSSTGGEPLLRADGLADLIGDLTSLPGKGGHRGAEDQRRWCSYKRRRMRCAPQACSASRSA